MTNASALDLRGPQEEPDLCENLDLYLTFGLGDEIFAITIEHVREIVGIQKITRVPDLPCFYKGIVNLRGRVIPVIDMRVRLGLAERSYNERTCIVVVDVEEQTVGLVVEEIREVLQIQAENVESPPGEGETDGFISGLGKVEKEVKIILDVKALMR